MTERTLEMRTEFAGDEFPVTVHCSPDRVIINNGTHGEIYLSWDDFNKMLAETSWYKRAKATTDFDDASIAAE